QRRPRERNYSVERLFTTVREALRDEIDCRMAICRFESNGMVRRLYCIMEAALRQRGINHVTGDVTYLTYLLRKDRTLLTMLDCSSMHRLSGWKKLLFRIFWLQIPVWRSALISVISPFSKAELL